MRKRAILLSVLLLGLLSALSYAQAPVPFINLPLIPDAAAPGGEDFTLTVDGTGFVSNSAVNWNGSALVTQFVSSSRLTAVVPAANTATASTASVTVVNPSPGGGTSNVTFFPVAVPVFVIGFGRTDYGVGSQPLFLATADLNGDGKLDLVVVTLSGSVSVFLGNGDGTFQKPVNYATFEPVAVIVGDFNGDGKLDLAVLCQPSTVSVFLGNGDGTFRPAVNYPTGYLTDHGITVDVNGDGKLDIVTANQRTNTVSVLLGNGDGTFAPHVDYGIGEVPTNVAAGDFNGDGKLDLVVSNYGSASVSILLGNGDGTFQPKTDYPAGSGPGGVKVADLNGDGKLDLVVPNQTSATVSILLGNGDGTFGPPTAYPISAGGVRAEVADLNQDGKLDLAVITYKPSVDILLGKGDGTFQSPLSFPVGNNPYGVVAGDFNGEGPLDLAVTNNSSASVSVLLQATTVALSKKTLKFADQLVGATSSAQNVTLRNTGAVPLSVLSVTVTGTNSTDFAQTDTCGSSVPPGASCVVSVTFTPTAQGTRTGAVTIKDNAAKNPQTISLTGTGTVVELSPASLDFGNQPVGTTSTAQTVTITNTGSTLLNIHGIGIAGPDFGDFGYTTTCSASLLPNASCAVNVTFTPTITGARTGAAKVSDDGGGSPQAVTLSGTGT